MNAPIESTLTLEQVTEHFEQWRNRKKNGERIPEQLWNEAVSLVDIYGVSQVTRTLRLGGSDLNKRRGMVEASQRRQGPSGKTAFVEIDPVVMDQALAAQASAAWMELERPDGLRLRIRPTGGADMLALIDRFMGA
ncbi:MAG: hypothetical protein GY701_12315 [Sulfitobacter sp.]|nr:hypothetical protein [Sulfitobacter sp.]